jgi:transcriptional regulator with XRE-family HTH domain
MEQALHAAQGQDEQALGPALRQARASRGLSLAAVAAQTGVSRSLLSLIENGRSDITLRKLSLLADLYEVRISELLGSGRDDECVAVVRHGEMPTLHSSEDRVDMHLLVPDGARAMMGLLIEIGPGGGAQERMSHAGEELIHVLDGRIVLEVTGSKTVELNAGDSAYYPSDRGHRITNPGEATTARVIVVATPPQL